MEPKGSLQYSQTRSQVPAISGLRVLAENFTLGVHATYRSASGGKNCKRRALPSVVNL
jgi:hypothetical protein